MRSLTVSLLQPGTPRLHCQPVLSITRPTVSCRHFRRLTRSHRTAASIGEQPLVQPGDSIDEQPAAADPGALKESLHASITEALKPATLKIEDVSGDCRHISIEIVADAFEGQTSVARQRMVYKSIWKELQGAVHAVDAMVCQAPSEVRDSAALQQPAPQHKIAGLVDWKDVGRLAGQDVLQGYQLLPGDSSAPRSAPSRVIPTQEHPQTTAEVLLYVDTDSWCPFCERIKFAMLEKGIDYVTMFIPLRGERPAWYKVKVPSNQVPAAVIKGELVWDSSNILQRLEDAFPQHPLWPSDPEVRQAAQEAAKGADALASAGYRFLRAAQSRGSGQAQDPAGRSSNGDGGPGRGPRAVGLAPSASGSDGARAAFEQELSHLEGRLSQQDGPYLSGNFSTADIIYASTLSRFAANMPVFKGFHLRANPQYPALDAWYAAIESRPAYQKVCSDARTHNMVFRKLFGAAAAPQLPGDALKMRGRREAAAKLHSNHQVVLHDILNRSGILGASQMVVVNGWPSEPKPHAVQAVDYTMRRIANELLQGDPGPRHDEAEARALGAAAAAFLMNRASAPRDLSAAACTELRQACLAVLQETY